MQKITKKNSCLYNQLWITKAIEEGHINFLPVHKLPDKSIGEHIEIKYNQLYNEEFDKNFRNDTLDYYNHLISETPKITKRDSLLFTMEWITKAREDGFPIPTRKAGLNLSIGEILESQYSERELLNEENDLNKIFELSGEAYSRKKLRK